MQISKMLRKLLAVVIISAMIFVPFVLPIYNSFLQTANSTPFNPFNNSPSDNSQKWGIADTTKVVIKPVALVYSKLQLSCMLINETAWTLFSIEDLVTITGVPYKVYPVDEFIDMNFNDFSVIILFNTLHMNNSLFDSFYVKLQTYLKEGGNIISIDFPPLMNETEAYNETYLNEIFNAKYATYLDNISYNILPGSLPTLSLSYGPTDVVWSYKKRVDLNSLDVYNTSLNTYTIAVANYNGQSYNLAIATDFGYGKTAIFAAPGYYEWIDQTMLLSRTIQWCIFGDLPPVSLLISPGNLTYMFTVDADLSSIPSITIPAVNRLLNYSLDYRFPFSWGIVTGPHPPGFIPNWTILDPYYERIVELGNELASHSRTHPVWKTISLNDTHRVEWEVGGSKLDIEGNLSVPIEVFHTPDGYFYENWFPILAKYYNLTITTESDMAPLMGGFYYPHITKDFIYLWRTTYADFEYYDIFNLQGEEIVNLEMQNFYKFYKFNRGILYINLWHDYSIANDTTNAQLKEILQKQLAETPYVYTMMPLEFEKKLFALRDITFTVTYNEDNEIDIAVDTRKISSDILAYTGNFAFLIENNKHIASVKIDNNPHYMFSDNKVILPPLTQAKIYTISVTFGKPTVPHIVFTDMFATSMNIAPNNYTITVSDTIKRLGVIQLETASTPKFVLINNEIGQWKYNNGLLTINVSTLSGPVEVSVYFYGDIELKSIESQKVYVQDIAKRHTINTTAFIENTIDHQVELNAIVYLLTKNRKTVVTANIEKISLDENTTTEVILPIKRPKQGWTAGNYTLLVVLSSPDNKTFTKSYYYTGAILILDKQAFFKTAGTIGIVILVIAGLAVLCKKIRNKRRKEKELFSWLEENKTE